MLAGVKGSIFAWGIEQADDIVLDYLTDSRYARGDDRQTAGHGFDGNQSKTFAYGRREQHIVPVEISRHIIGGGDERHTSSDSKSSRGGCQLLAIRS